MSNTPAATRVRLVGAAVLAGLWLAWPARPADEHAAHRAAAAAPLQIRNDDYQVPDVLLQDQRGVPVRLRTLLADDQP
ncbi:MAG: hypothetical protein KGJ52_12200, partial [Gammaproteobacteria bacterium]|nr:hypothetical protein [Gammaproteobacteria bacterium]